MNKTRFIQFRVTRDQYERIKNNARAKGYLNLSHFLRDLALDKNLIFDARRENVKVIEIRSTNFDEQLKQVLKNVKIDEKIFLSRCLLCNNLVEEIDKKNVKNNVPARVFENNEKFWYCKDCDKIYWKGSHFENMLQKLSSYSILTI